MQRNVTFRVSNFKRYASTCRFNIGDTGKFFIFTYLSFLTAVTIPTLNKTSLGRDKTDTKYRLSTFSKLGCSNNFQ